MAIAKEPWCSAKEVLAIAKESWCSSKEALAIAKEFFGVLQKRHLQSQKSLRNLHKRHWQPQRSFGVLQKRHWQSQKRPLEGCKRGHGNLQEKDISSDSTQLSTICIQKLTALLDSSNNIKPARQEVFYAAV